MKNISKKKSAKKEPILTKEEVLTNLCYHNPLSPEHDLEDEKPKDCYCDNCFYGRDKLAREILRLNNKIFNFRQ